MDVGWRRTQTNAEQHINTHIWWFDLSATYIRIRICRLPLILISRRCFSLQNHHWVNYALSAYPSSQFMHFVSISVQVWKSFSSLALSWSRMEIFSSISGVDGIFGRTAGITSLSIPLVLFHHENCQSHSLAWLPRIKVSYITSYDRRQSCLHDIYDKPDIPKPWIARRCAQVGA